MLVRGLAPVRGGFARHVDEVTERLQTAGRCSHGSLESHGVSTVKAPAGVKRRR